MSAAIRLVGGPLQTERMPDGRRRLLRDLVVEVDSERITVPQGAITDFSSIPWFGRMLVRWSKVDIAGVVHDWLYQRGTTSRERADEIWRLLAVSGQHRASAVQARIAWLALRVGGGPAWRRHRSRDAEPAPVESED
jgi:hypothetical protein